MGRLAQPLRLVRRRCLPDLGLSAALSPARPHRSAARSRPARGGAGRWRNRGRRPPPLLARLPRLARGPRPGRLRPGRRRPACPARHALCDMSIVLVGISHHQAPVELRERAALDPERAAKLARTLAGDRSEAVCLSTCNRTELYLADESPE